MGIQGNWDVYAKAYLTVGEDGYFQWHVEQNPNGYDSMISGLFTCVHFNEFDKLPDPTTAYSSSFSSLSSSNGTKTASWAQACPITGVYGAFSASGPTEELVYAQATANGTSAEVQTHVEVPLRVETMCTNFFQLGWTWTYHHTGPRPPDGFSNGAQPLNFSSSDQWCYTEGVGAGATNAPAPINAYLQINPQGEYEEVVQSGNGKGGTFWWNCLPLKQP